MQKYIKTALDSAIIEPRKVDLNYKKVFFCDRREFGFMEAFFAYLDY
jgi:hypothetical protein